MAKVANMRVNLIGTGTTREIKKCWLSEFENMRSSRLATNFYIPRKRQRA